MNVGTIGFIGFGLIGGSIAKALKQPDTTINIYVYQREKDLVNKALYNALSDGIIDRFVNELNELQSCDIIFLCAPVRANISYLQKLKPILSDSCILTDVGSVKGDIHKFVSELGLSRIFIGGHPMAGSEKSGYENSSAQLLENAYYILTPSADVPDDKVEILTSIVKQLKAIPIVLDAKEHDDITAAISHVPHIIAASLVNLIRENDDKEEHMKALAAGGFKDITRIASSSPSMWQNICYSNQQSILKFLKRFIQKLDDFYKEIVILDDDSVLQEFSQANEYRSLIPNSTGLIQKVHDLYVDIQDETGAIASVATLLATHQISIKNIGIVHNREFEQGVLRIETYEETDKMNALSLLTRNRYTVYEHK